MGWLRCCSASAASFANDKAKLQHFILIYQALTHRSISVFTAARKSAPTAGGVKK
jgi:hypothetical protein